MDDFQAQLAGLRQTLVDLDGDGIPDAAPSARSQRPINPNELDPMTAGQMEASRRAVADARFQQGAPKAANMAFELTGVPTMYRGSQDIATGYSEGNPMQMLRGGARVAVGAMPWTRAGRAMFGAAPVTTTAAALTLPNADISIPGAQAAESMPPLPVQRDAPQPAPEQENSQGVASTFWDQVRNNAYQAASGIYEGARGAYNELANEREKGFKEIPYEEWAKQNAASDLAAANKAEADSRKKIDGVNARTANSIRSQAAQKSEQLRSQVRQAYDRYVSEGRASYENELNTKTFAQRNPNLNAMLTFAPAIISGGRYARAVGRQNRDIAKRVSSSGKTTQAQQDELAALLAKKPNFLPYAGQAFAGSAVAKAATDYYDATSLPTDSEARSRVRQGYIPYDDEGNFAPKELLNTAGNYAMRGALSLAAPVAASVLSRGLPESVRQQALSKAKIPNVAGNKQRISAQRELDEIQKSQQPTWNQMLRARFPQSPTGPKSPTGPIQPSPQSPTGPIQPSTRQIGPSGQGASTQTNPSVPTNPNPAIGQGSPVPPSQRSVRVPSLSPKMKEDIRLSMAENNGRLTMTQAQSIAPNVNPEKLKKYLETQKKAFNELGSDGYRKASPYFLGGTGAAVGLNEMLRVRDQN